MLRFFQSLASAILAIKLGMITIKKDRLIIEIQTKEPKKYLRSINQTLQRTNRRMLNSDDLFNDPDTVTDIDNLMLLKEELSIIGGKRPKKKSK